jgi:hypothetical protein
MKVGARWDAGEWDDGGRGVVWMDGIVRMVGGSGSKGEERVRSGMVWDGMDGISTPSRSQVGPQSPTHRSILDN